MKYEYASQIVLFFVVVYFCSSYNPYFILDFYHCLYSCEMVPLPQLGATFVSFKSGVINGL